MRAEFISARFFISRQQFVRIVILPCTVMFAIIAQSYWNAWGALHYNEVC